MKIITFIFITLLSINAFSQDTSASVIKTKQNLDGEIIFHGDSAINGAIRSHIAINKKKCPQLIKGYRVQISSSNGADARAKTSADKIKFLSLFPDVNAHDLWEAPSYKVRVGDCRTKFEAEQLKKLIQVNFPFCFVVPDYIDTYYIPNCK
jgi:hypothetical protein